MQSNNLCCVNRATTIIVCWPDSFVGLAGFVQSAVRTALSRRGSSVVIGAGAFNATLSPTLYGYKRTRIDPSQLLT